MPKKPKPARKTGTHDEPKPRLGDVTFGPSGASLIGFSNNYNSHLWTHHTDALMLIVAPSWAWTCPGSITILDHANGRRIV